MFFMHFLCFLSGISIEYLPHIVLSPVASTEYLCQPHKLIKLDRERKRESERSQCKGKLIARKLLWLAE